MRVKRKGAQVGGETPLSLAYREGCHRGRRSLNRCRHVVLGGNANGSEGCSIVAWAMSSTVNRHREQSTGSRCRRRVTLSDVDAFAFIGYWRTTHIETWAQDSVGVVVPGFIEFKPEEDHLMGTFPFGTVSGWLDCRLRDIDAATFIEWSWQGQSDTDPGNGRRGTTDGRRTRRAHLHSRR
jgi:hypothetical protein